MKKLFTLLLALAMVLSLCAPALAAEAEAETVNVLYTNDVHTYIDKDLNYTVAAMYRDTLDNVLMVDAGDHVQGTAYGSMDKGETIIKLMNAAGYDLATLGNHEFDYGMEGCMNAIEWAEFPYVSCNFYHEENGVKGENVLDAYKVFEIGGQKIAFIGITTPESFTKSTPAYFQDEEGNYIYGIAGGEDGSDLYATVQEAIDAASEEADVIIGLGHLGVDPASKPWTSEEVIANTTGFDAFIDEVVTERLPNPFMPDAPQRIATDTSQKVGIRFGETVKSYIAQNRDLNDLTAIPIAIAGWMRYLLAVDDELRPIPVSDDPLREELQTMLSGIVVGKPETYSGQLRDILSTASVFGLDLTVTPLADKIENYFISELSGPGAVRRTLHEALKEV